jgi:2-polyprenyl-6-hydroxyphenyl methylase/3-demethylubiquinone-9 3-methyltransferase
MASKPKTGTINPREAAHFGALAEDWWNPKGSSAMLHKLNPVRLRYIREAIDRHWSGAAQAMRPLTGKRALDVGCGAGLLCEPLARLGAAVTGIDAAPENVAVAQAHAARSGLAIDYRATPVEALDQPPFDLVTALEVVEHVADPALFLSSLGRLLREDGLLILSTPNRTALSRVAMISIGEGLGQIPRGTHDWEAFRTPDEMRALLTQAGFAVSDLRGIGYDPLRGLHLSDRTELNYILTAVRAA